MTIPNEKIIGQKSTPPLTKTDFLENSCVQLSSPAQIKRAGVMKIKKNARTGKENP